MSETSDNISPKSLPQIKEAFFAGSAALDKSGEAELFVALEIELKQTISSVELLTNAQTTKIFNEIFSSVFEGGFANKLMQIIDKEVYFSFGESLLKSFENKNPIGILPKLTHEYLNLFRISAFLKRIYEEKKWEKLILNLIIASNYTFSVLFNQRLRDYRTKSLFKTIHTGKVSRLNWEETAKRVSHFSQALNNMLNELDSPDGKVAFLLENCLEMPLLDIACLNSGIVNVMIPANSVSEHIVFILNETKAPVIFVHDEKQLSKIRSAKINLPYLKKVMLLNGSVTDEWIISFNKFLNAADVKNNNENANTPDINSLATLMYTSGTTGEPKGIMFSHLNIVYKRFCRAMALPEIGDDDRFLSFLPLYHTFGRYLEMVGSIFWAAEYVFMENPAVETMISNMQTVKPSIFISIPKKWMQLYEYITARVDVEVEDHQTIKETVDNATGGNLKWGLSAAGYLPTEIFIFFQSYRIELMSGFGMTEATGGITMTPPKKYKSDSLGNTLPGIEIKLNDDGELLVKGAYVMVGYFDKDNNKTFTEDGYLPTGDIMKMDEDGFIEIIDRKKEIYKNIKGETIAPQKIENLFRDFENVKQVFLVGDHRQFNTVLIYPNDDKNSLLSGMDEKQKQEYFSSVIVTVNKFLSPFERILDFRLVNRLFSDAHGELTPKGTFKRRVIENNFSDLIESMYTKAHTSLIIDETEVRIPLWFLREKGSLSRNIISNDTGIAIPKLGLKLNISRVQEKIFRIGSFNYTVNSNYIDLQTLFTNPLLWIGNKKLVEFTGKSIIKWYREDTEKVNLQYHSKAELVMCGKTEVDAFAKFETYNEYSSWSLHHAYIILQTESEEDSTRAVKFFANILSDETIHNYNLAFRLTLRPNITNYLSIRRELFRVSINKLNAANFETALQTYLDNDNNFLNEDIINTIVEKNKGEEKLSILEFQLRRKIKELNTETDIHLTSVPSLFSLLTIYGIKHPVSHKRIRRSLMRYSVLGKTEVVREIAFDSLQKLIEGFRKWLGNNQSVTIDPETMQEYTWEDVLSFEEGIDAEDRFRIKNTLIKTPVLREAVFLFSSGVILRLENLLPSGIWISLLQSRNVKSIFRVSIQTRFQGSFDITLHLNKDLEPGIVRNEMKWLILAGTAENGERLLPKFGGYWDEYDLWSEEFVPRDSVEKFIKKEITRQEDNYQQRLSFLWPHFVWNAAATYFSFWKLTNYKIDLAEPSPNYITVPTHDYQTGTLLYSISSRRDSTSVKEFFINFYNLFIKETENKYDFLKNNSIWNYIFSGVIESAGEERGGLILQELYEQLKAEKDFHDINELLSYLASFIENIKENGFVPRPLFFAIKRFLRWFELNAEADLNAQAAMLKDLYDTYHLFELEEEHPSTRVQFYLQTAFRESNEELKEGMQNIIREMIGNQKKENLQSKISELHNQFTINEKEEFFLTRVSYPHLKPDDTATLIKSKSQGVLLSNLVVQLRDQDGVGYFIRNPISPKEISRLHQLFFESNLIVHFHADQQFLVAVSERGHLIGGLFYNFVDETTAHMDKIVVSNRFRRKGISEGLMNELFNRLTAEHFKYVTTGFFRPEYFYKFGFNVEKKYSGLVKELSAVSNSTN